MYKAIKTAGVLGGMGPQATIDLYRRIIDKSIKSYGIKDNSEFPEIYILNHSPKTLLNNDETSFERLKDDILNHVEKLLRNDVDFFVIPCNTIHYFTKDIRERFSTPFVSILESVVKSVVESKIKNLSIVGSKTTIQNKLYENPLNAVGFDNILLPDEKEQDELVDIIESIISRGANIKDANRLDNILSRLKDRGAEAVILGCTELPLVKNMLKTDLVIFDSIDILADAVCENIFIRKDQLLLDVG